MRFAANDRQPDHSRTGLALHKRTDDALLCGRGTGRVLTINVAVLLAVIVVLRLRRRTQARSRLDEKFTVVIVLAFGVLIAPTDFGQGVLSVLSQLVQGISQAG